MRSLFLMTCSVWLAGCHSRTGNPGAASSWACSIEERAVSHMMGSAVDDLAKGPDRQWNEIMEVWKARRLDGIAATCFVVGLGELFARAPTVFLERRLAGDVFAKELAREGYNLLYSTQIMQGRGFNPGKARSNALSMYQQRASISNEETEKRINEFVSYITMEK